MPEDLCACDQSGAAVDLDAWRAEAGACALLDAAATRDWCMGGVDAGDGRQVITGGPIPLAHIRVSCVTTSGRDGSREITPEQRDNDARFAVAARDGWPRDAARVARLCDEVATLRAALGEALDELDSALCVATGVCAMTSECRERDRLRALLSDDFMRLDPSR